MLNNKSSMLKVLVLALSVLMLVSLAACGSTGVDESAMNEAIQNAIAAQQSEQAAKDAALQSSIAAAQSEQAAKDAALQSSIAEEQAKQSEALAKAEAEASKAAASAAEASKAAASASIEASKQAASLAAVSSAQKTTVPTSATTTAIVKEDTSAVLAEYAKMKHQYTFTDMEYYEADAYTELVLLFDKAGVELNNAMTVKAAEDILASLKVEALAVESVKTRAMAVQALIADLGDIETAVFTTAAEKIVAARDAYNALKADYAEYFDYDAKNKADGANTVKVANKLGIDTADLAKAEGKLEVLESYIEAAMWADMETLYAADDRMKYDAEDDIDATVLNTAETYRSLINRVYYKYLVLATINGGDMSEADCAVEFEYYDKDGKEVDAPVAGGKTVTTKYFTAEDLLNVYILPTLEQKFTEDKAASLAALKSALAIDAKYAALSAAVTDIAGHKLIADKGDIEDAFEEAIDAYEAELANLSYVNDYKGSKKYADALKDVGTRYQKAYIAAIVPVIELSKEVAIEVYTEYTYDVNVEALENKYADEKYEETLAKKLDSEAKNLATFTANVTAAPSYDYAALNAAALRKEHGNVKALTDGSMLSGAAATAKFYTYVDAVVAAAINDNFKTRIASTDQAGLLGELAIVMIEDLEALREQLNAEEDGKLWIAYRGSKVVYLEDTYANDATIAELVTAVDKAIADIQAIDETKYADKEEALKYPKTTSGDYKSWSEKPLYFLNAEAKAYAEAEKMDEAALKAAGKTLLTTTKNDLALTYTWTATEQACGDAYKVYTTVYNTIHSKLLSMAGNVATNQKLITNDTEYKAILTRVGSNAALKAEVEAFAAIYTKAISDLSAIKNVKALPGYVSTSATIATEHSTITTAETDMATVYGNHAAVKFTELSEKMAAKATEFEGKFWTGSECNVITLWNHKSNAVDTLTTALNGVKNSYTKDAQGNPVQIPGTMAYDEGLTAASVKGAQFEAKVDAILADYAAKINAVKLDTKVEVKNAAGAVVLAKAGDYSLANSQATVDAYLTAAEQDVNQSYNLIIKGIY